MGRFFTFGDTHGPNTGDPSRRGGLPGGSASNVHSPVKEAAANQWVSHIPGRELDATQETNQGSARGRDAERMAGIKRKGTTRVHIIQSPTATTCDTNGTNPAITRGSAPR